MFKKGQFICDKDYPDRIYKVMKVTYDLGHNRIYILRPKGARSDNYDEEVSVSYVNQEYELVQKHKKLADLPDDYHELLKVIMDF